MPHTKNGSSAVLMLTLLIFLNFFAFMQMFCTPVMLPLISEDLNLNTAQLGLIWGMSTFGGLFLSLPCGLMGDRIGPRWGIFIIAIISAISLGIRGFATDTIMMATMMFIGGGVIGGLTPLSTKAIFSWFPPTRVGLANGLLAGFCRLGMALGAAVSATVVAVLLRNWQNTFFLYAAILLVFALLWLLIIREPQNSKAATGVPFREALTKTVRSRDVWLCVVTYIGVIGLNVGFVGYLPTYLQNIGWSEGTSSLALTVYFLSQVIGSFILPTISDKTRLRKIFFIIPGLIYVISIGLLAVTKTAAPIWILTFIAGFAIGSLAPILTVVVAEIKEIGARYAGTANSIGFGISGAGGLLFAVVGGKLALTNAIFPFIFGSLLCLVFIIPFFFTRETGTRNSGIIKNKK
ncbi:MAG: MFS transporter [Dehalococcoidales bacterium]|nr:MFS transporter [Dehalococcoidales bacterium]